MKETKGRSSIEGHMLLRLASALTSVSLDLEPVVGTNQVYPRKHRTRDNWVPTVCFPRFPKVFIISTSMNRKDEKLCELLADLSGFEPRPADWKLDVQTTTPGRHINRKGMNGRQR